MLPGVAQVYTVDGEPTQTIVRLYCDRQIASDRAVEVVRSSSAYTMSVLTPRVCPCSPQKGPCASPNLGEPRWTHPSLYGALLRPQPLRASTHPADANAAAGGLVSGPTGEEGYYYSVINGYRAFRFHTDLRESVVVDKLGSFKNESQAHSTGGYSLVKVINSCRFQSGCIVLRSRALKGCQAEGRAGTLASAKRPLPHRCSLQMYTGGSKCGKGSAASTTIATYSCGGVSGWGKIVDVDPSEDCTYRIDVRTPRACNCPPPPAPPPAPAGCYVPEPGELVCQLRGCTWGGRNGGVPRGLLSSTLHLYLSCSCWPGILIPKPRP